MPPPYCGGKASAPRGRALAGDAAACRRQIRAYGRRLVAPGFDARHDAAALLQGESGGSRHCGALNGGARQADCAPRHVRLYGLLPVVEAAADLRRRTFVARDAASHLDLPIPPPARTHAYTLGVLAGTNVHSKGKEVVFVSVGVGDDGDSWARAPTTTPGGVGYAFGYFAGRRRGVADFAIAGVYVNPAYRRGKGGGGGGPTISSWVVEQLVASVVRRAREGDLRRVRLAVDPNAPCFQLGHPHHQTPAQSAALERMYVDAGFTVVPLPHEGRDRRTVERLVEL